MESNDQTGSSADQPGTDASGADGAGTSGQNPWRDQGARARELGERWVGQLQEMIDQAGRQAGPVLRDVAAKAAELAAVAAENAGPVAHKAASVTEHVGDRLAARSKDLAADLRKAAEQARASQAAETPADDSKPEDGPTA
jgi:hypothetical protein